MYNNNNNNIPIITTIIIMFGHRVAAALGSIRQKRCGSFPPHLKGQPKK